jgi:hypothetical protein
MPVSECSDNGVILGFYQTLFLIRTSTKSCEKHIRRAHDKALFDKERSTYVYDRTINIKLE